MINGQGRQLVLHLGDGGQGNLLAVPAGHIDVAQALGRSPDARVGVQDHPVLVDLGIGHPGQALAEGVVEHGIDVGHGHAQARGRVAIDDHRGHEPPGLLVGDDVGYLRQLAQPFLDLGRPLGQLGKIVAQKRKLVEGLARPAAQAQFLGRHEKGLGPGQLGQGFAQPHERHLDGRPFVLGFEGHEHLGRIDRAAARSAAAAGKAGDAFHVRVVFDDANDLGQPPFHVLKRAVLGGLDKSHEPAGVLFREKALGNDDIEPDRAAQGGGRGGQHGLGML